jgi:hypothetical protein
MPPIGSWTYGSLGLIARSQPCDGHISAPMTLCCGRQRSLTICTSSTALGKSWCRRCTTLYGESPPTEAASCRNEKRNSNESGRYYPHCDRNHHFAVDRTHERTPFLEFHSPSRLGVETAAFLSFQIRALPCLCVRRIVSATTAARNFDRLAISPLMSGLKTIETQCGAEKAAEEAKEMSDKTPYQTKDLGYML